MKKFSKIILILLAVSLLCGLTLVFASAADEVNDRERLNITGNSLNRYTSATEKVNTKANYGAVREQWSKTTASIEFRSTGDNTYIQLGVLEDPSKYVNGYMFWDADMYNGANNSNPFSSNNMADYATVDIDFGTDKYVYSDGSAYHTVYNYEDIPEEYRDSADLALIDGNQIRLQFRGTTTVYSPALTVVKKDGIWQYQIKNIGTDDVYVPMSNKVGVFDHITWVIDFDYAKSTGYMDGSIGYVYINGEFAAAQMLGGTNITNYNFCGIEIPIAGKENFGVDRFSFALDNMALNVYKKDQNKTVDGYIAELDAYFAGSYKTTPLYTLNGVVYSESYISPNGYIEVDGVVSSIPSVFNQLLENITRNSVIKTTCDIYDLVVPEGIESFEIMTTNNSKVTLSQQSLQNYQIDISLLGYKISKISEESSTSIRIQWLDNKENGNVILEERLVPGAVPSFGKVGENIYIYNYETGKIDICSVDQWLWDIDGAGNEAANFNRPPEAIRALSEEEIALAAQYCNGVIKIYPNEIAEIDSLAPQYTLFSSDSKLVIGTDKSFDCYLDATTFAKELSAAPSGTLATIFCDVTVADAVAISAGKSIAIDLNGYNFTSTAVSAFRLSNNASVSLNTTESTLKYDYLLTGNGTLSLSAGLTLSDDAREYNGVQILAGVAVAHSAGNSTITFDPENAEPTDFTLVVWKDGNGDNFASDYYHKDYTTIFHPDVSVMTDAAKFPKVEEGDTGWFDIGYTGWKAETENADLDTLVMGEDNVFAPAEGPVSFLDLKINVSLETTSVGLNFCLPVPEENGAVVFDAATGAYYLNAGSRESIAVSIIDIDGKAFYLIERPVALDSFDPVTFYVEYTANLEGSSPVALTKEITFDFMTYAEMVAEVYTCGTDDSALVFDLVTYKYQAYLTSVGNNIDPAVENRVEEFFKTHDEDGCGCASNVDLITFSDEEKSASVSENEALSDKILFAGFNVTNLNPSLVFYVSNEVNVESLAVTLRAPEHDAAGWEHINNKKTFSLTKTGETEYNGTVCSVYEYSALMLVDAAAIMDIELKLDVTPDGAVEKVIETFNGNFSLGAFCIEIARTDMISANMAKALYVASKSAVDYRTVVGDEAE